MTFEWENQCQRAFRFINNSHWAHQSRVQLMQAKGIPARTSDFPSKSSKFFLPAINVIIPPMDANAIRMWQASTSRCGSKIMTIFQHFPLTVGVLSRGGGLLSRFFDCRSNRIDGATVVGGAGVAIGTRVPSWRKCNGYKGRIKCGIAIVIKRRRDKQAFGEFVINKTRALRKYARQNLSSS